MIVAALLISAGILLVLGLWGARDLVEDADGVLTDRHKLADKYGRLPLTHHQEAVLRRQQRKLLRYSGKVVQLQQRIAATPLGAGAPKEKTKGDP